MENKYHLLYSKYHKIIDSEISPFTCLIDGKKQKYDHYIHLDLQFLKLVEEYLAILKINELTGISKLEFFGAKQNDGNLLNSYLLSFFSSEDICFYKQINGVIVNDYHNFMFGVKEILLDSLNVDNNVLKVLKTNFNQLEVVNFSNCKIDRNCDFYRLESNLHFKNCEISSTSSFSYCYQNLTVQNCKINEIVPSTIYSSKFNIDNLDDWDLTNLFFYSHFPALKTLTIGNPSFNNVNPFSYHRCLSFLPFACPSLYKLEVNGKIYSFDFLYHFNQLNECEIKSVNDSIGCYEIYNPYIIKDEERNKIIDKSNCDNTDELAMHLAIRKSLNQIMDMLNVVSFTEEEKKIYFGDQIPNMLFSSIQKEEIESYFLYDKNKKGLKLCQQNDGMMLFQNGIFMTKDPFKSDYIQGNPEIIISKPFLYHPSGIPIIENEKGFSDVEYINRAITMQDMFYEEDTKQYQK